jgi:kynurenine formamidase
MMTTRLIDLSHPLDAGTPPWPGNPPVDVAVLDAIPSERGPGQRGVPGKPGYVNVTAVRTCNHTGTHMDAPAHFYNGVPTIEQVPLDRCIGPAARVDVRHAGPRGEIPPAELTRYEAAITATGKVVFWTGWSDRWGQADYFRDFPVLSEAAAAWLVARGVHLVALDTPSVDREPNPAHFLLLGAGAVIVENLTGLALIDRDVFELIVLPLPLRGLEASPVRAVARVETEPGTR